MMPKYDVGQVLFILAGPTQGVVPVRVCEEIKRKSLSGTTVDYLVNFPGLDESVNLKKAKKLVFVSETDTKVYMMNNAELAIDNLLKKAAAVAKKTFSYEPVTSDDTLVDTVDVSCAGPIADAEEDETEALAPPLLETLSPAQIEVGGTTLMLEDGTAARIHLPPEFQDLIGSG
jgi:hypothetical protein